MVWTFNDEVISFLLPGFEAGYGLDDIISMPTVFLGFTLTSAGVGLKEQLDPAFGKISTTDVDLKLFTRHRCNGLDGPH